MHIAYAVHIKHSNRYFHSRVWKRISFKNIDRFKIVFFNPDIQTLNFFPLRGHSHLSFPSSWVFACINFSTSVSLFFGPAINTTFW